MKKELYMVVKNNTKKKLELRLRKYYLEDGLIKSKYCYEKYFDDEYYLNLYLSNLNENDYVLKFKDLFIFLLETKECNHETLEDYKYSFRLMASIHNIEFTTITKEDLKELIDSFESKALVKKAKLLLSQLYKLALKSKIIKEDFTKSIRCHYIVNETLYYKNYFIKAELSMMKNKPFNTFTYDIILFMINTGIKVNDVLGLKITDIKDKKIIINKSYINNENELNDIALGIYNKYKKINKLYLFENRGKKLTYDNFYKRYFKKMMDYYGFDHIPRDCYATYLHSKSDKSKRKNGRGTIKEYVGNKKVYYAIVSIRNKRVSIGAFESRDAALNALDEYYDNSIKLKNKNILLSTFKDIYLMFIQFKIEEGKSRNPVKQYNYAFNALSMLHNKRFNLLSTADLMQALYDSKKNWPTIKVMILLIKQMYKVAIANNVIKGNKSELVSVGKYSDLSKNPNSITHSTFTKKEIEIILSNNGNKYMTDIFKFLIYTGLRINEFITLTKDEIDLNNRTIHIKEEHSKTGIERYIPIHPNIYDLVKNKYYTLKSNDDYLFKSLNKKPFNSWNFRNTYWKPFMKLFNMNHLPHDTRYTFSTFCGYCKISVRDREIIMGHSVKGDVKRIYDQPELLHRYSELCKLRFDIEFYNN